MGVLADHQIRSRAKYKTEMKDRVWPDGTDLSDLAITITPFTNQCPKGVISYGVSSYGYDVRVGYKFKVFTPVHCGVVDPKHFDPQCFVDVDLTQNAPHHLEFCTTTESYCCKNCGVTIDQTETTIQNAGRSCPKGKPDHVLIPANSFALAETLEYVEIPRDCVGLLFDKSTYRRCGVVVSATVLEPSWRGKITIEISNTAPLPAKVYTGEGIAQILFMKGDSICETSYEDKRGVYQSQEGIILPRIKQ